MLSIDEAITHAREVADKNSGCWKHCNCTDNDCNICEEEHDQLAEWLEELKEYRNHNRWTIHAQDSLVATKAYNKALDDFVKFANTMPTVEEEDGEIRPMWLEEMSEKLKAGDL